VTLTIHPEATREFQHSARYYRTISDQLSSRFIREIEESLRAIAASPELYPFRFAPARAKQLKVFPFFVVYFAEDDRITVLAVAHMKRRPGYWRSRM